MNKILTLIFFLNSLSSTAQSISLSTLNIGGGTSKLNNGVQVDWSIAEGASIQSFTGTNGLFLQTGILQPFTINGDIVLYNGSTNWSFGEISNSPNPTPGILNILIKIAESGTISLKLIDGNGKIFIVKSFYYNKTNGAYQFNLSALPSGNYYLNATLSHPFISVIKRTGTFKIIKQ